MVEHSVELVEMAADVELAEIYGTDVDVNKRASSRVLGLDFGETLNQIAEHYSDYEYPVYPTDELVPRLYDTEVGAPFSGTTPPPKIGYTQKIWPLLVYAHKVEAVDPLVPTLAYASWLQRNPEKALWRGDSWVHLLDVALRTWHNLRPLVDAGIVVLVPPSHAKPPINLVEYARECCASQEFRALVAGLFPDWNPADEIAIDMADPDREKVRQIQIAKMSLEVPELGGSGCFEYLIDLQGLVGAGVDSHADHWFPSDKHLKLLNGLLREMGRPNVEHDEVLLGLTDILMPDPAVLSYKEIRNIRRDSAALEEWRKCVAAVYQELHGHGRIRAQAVLDASRVRLLDQLREELGTVWSGALRGLVLGAAGATPGLIVAEGARVGVTAMGAAAGFLANAIWGFTEQYNSRRAARAVEKHFLLLGQCVE